MDRDEILEKTHDILGFWTSHIEENIKRKYGDAVQAGPFKGMRIVAKAPGGIIGFFLMGSFEEELHPAIERLVGQDFTQVVNVGASEGYYAVGLALRLPKARILAFEADESLHPFLMENAEANGVGGQISMHGLCTVESLGDCLEEGALIAMDCEGAEGDILRPDKIPALRSATLLVEVHEFARAGLTQDLAARFAPTHHIEFIEVGARDPRTYPAMEGVAQFHQAIALCEFRPAQQNWAVMTPR